MNIPIVRARITEAALNLLRRHGVRAEAALTADFERAVDDVLVGDAPETVTLIAMPEITLAQWQALRPIAQVAIHRLLGPELGPDDTPTLRDLWPALVSRVDDIVQELRTLKNERTVTK